MIRVLKYLESLVLNYSNHIFRVIGIGFIIHAIGLLMFGGISFIGVDTFIEYTVEILKIGILLLSIIAGILAAKLAIESAWSWVIIKLIVSLTFYLKSIPYYQKIYRESKNDDGLFGLINLFEFDPLEEINNAILKSVFLLILIGVLFIPSLLEKYKINQMKIIISVSLGIMLSILIILLELNFNASFM